MLYHNGSTLPTEISLNESPRIPSNSADAKTEVVSFVASIRS